MGITCNHNSAQGLHGLCPECTQDFNEDCIAWLDYGPHPTGDRNSAELYRLMNECCRVAPKKEEQEEEQEEETEQEQQEQQEHSVKAYRYGHDAGIPF